jgi:hypothetical protein
VAPSIAAQAARITHDLVLRRDLMLLLLLGRVAVDRSCWRRTVRDPPLRVEGGKGCRERHPRRMLGERGAGWPVRRDVSVACIAA